MGTKTKQVTVNEQAFTCDVCGNERQEIPFSKCTICSKEVCGSCAAYTEYDDELVCKACKKIGEPYEKEMDSVREAAEAACEKISERWEDKVEELE